MRPRSVVYLIVLLILAVFVLANWDEISRPADINLLVARVQAPLGTLLLGIVATILLLDAAFHALSRYSWSRERQTLMRDLEALRLRADQAEESRIHGLRESFERETAAIRAQLDRMLAMLHEPGARAADYHYADHSGMSAYGRGAEPALIEEDRR